MKKIYAPWRHEYVTGKEKKKRKEDLVNQCVFCDEFAQGDDEKNLILKRFKHCVVIMNYYPYNAGHVMVIPYEHKGDLRDLTPEVRAEMMEAANVTMQVIEDETKCQGFNVGVNMGVAGGGGIQEHVHIHVLPRWVGDTNFLATLGDTTLICTDFKEVYASFKKRFDDVSV